MHPDADAADEDSQDQIRGGSVARPIMDHCDQNDQLPHWTTTTAAARMQQPCPQSDAADSCTGSEE